MAGMQANETSTPEGPSALVTLARTRKIPACVFSRDDLLRLYEQLNVKLQEEANDRVSSVRKLPQDTEHYHLNHDVGNHTLINLHGLDLGRGDAA